MWIVSSFTHLSPRSGARSGMSAAPPILSTCVLHWFIANPDILENRFRTSVATLMLLSSYGMMREQSSANASALVEMAGSGRACLLGLVLGRIYRQSYRKSIYRPFSNYWSNSPVRYAKFESIRYFIDIDILQNCLIDIDIDISKITISISIFSKITLSISISISIFLELP